MRHLKRGGALAVHVSNRFLDLLPVVTGGAEWLEKKSMIVSNSPDEKRGVFTSTWVLIAANEDFTVLKVSNETSVRLIAMDTFTGQIRGTRSFQRLPLARTAQSKCHSVRDSVLK